jgi:hypothetical protein
MTKISGDSFGADFSRLKDALTQSAGDPGSIPAAAGAPVPEDLYSPIDSDAAETILGLNPTPFPGPGTGAWTPQSTATPEFHRQLTGGMLRAQLAESTLMAGAGRSLPGDDASLNPQPLPPRELLSRLASVARELQLGDEVTLNPQPLPPREAFLGIARHFGDEVALNPQPLPPREAVREFARRLGDAVALNPQPLPPRQTIAEIARRLGDEVALNPQPLPPREAVLEFARRLGDAVALNPQPLPPRDPGDPSPPMAAVYNHTTAILESGRLKKGQHLEFDGIVRQVMDQPATAVSQEPESRSAAEAWTRFKTAARESGY